MVEAKIRGAQDSPAITQNYETIVLKPHVVNGVNVISQQDVAGNNKKFVIKWGFTLTENLVFGVGCILDFDGGFFTNDEAHNYTITGNNTRVILNTDEAACLKRVYKGGTWLYPEFPLSPDEFTREDDVIVIGEKAVSAENIDDNAVTEETINPGAVTRRAMSKNPENSIADNEDLTVNDNGQLQLADKEYSPTDFSGLGRVYLRKNIVQRPNVASGSWITYAVDGITYLLYWYNNVLYNCHKADNYGLVVVNHIAVESADYDVEALPDYAQLNSLTYTESGGLITITLPDDTTITASSIYDVTLYPYEDNVDDINMLTQDMLSQASTIYIIQYDYELAENITIPENCVLEFEGGSILGEHTLTGANTDIQAGLVKIFNTYITLTGNWTVPEWYFEWFGAKGDGNTDDSDAVNAILKVLKNIGGGKVALLRKTYCTSPLDLREHSNTSIVGCPMAVAPWGNISTIKIIGNSDTVGIRMVSDYNPRGTSGTYEGKGILLQDFFLDCNNNVNKGINCRFNNTLKRVEVRNSNGDGIVLEAGTYPVYLENVRTQLNKGNGVTILSPNTTTYQINGLESWGNDGYGLYIEGGYNSNFNAVLLQSNKRGGMKILLRDSSDFDLPVYLGYLNFTGLYTEANGTLEMSDANYDGNYGIKLQGLTADATNFGKIEAITFINCKVDNPFIEGVAGIKNINSFGISYDQTKNGPIPGIPESLFTDGFKLGTTSFATFSFYDRVRNSNNYLTLKDSLNGVFTYTQVTNRIRLGGLVVIDSVISFEKDENTPPTGYMQLTTSDYYMGFHDNQDGELVGYCIISFSSSENPGLAQDTVLKYELIKDYSTVYIRDGYNKSIRWNELPANNGTLQLQLSLIH